MADEERRDSRSPKSGPSKDRGAFSPTPRSLGLLAWVLFFGALWILGTRWIEPPRETLSYSAFRDALGEGRVVSCRIGPQEIVGTLRPAEARAVTAPLDGAADTDAVPEPDLLRFRTVRVEDPELLADLRARGVEIEGVQPSAWPELLGWLLPFALIAFFWIYVLRRAAGGMGGVGQSAMGFGKSRARLVAENDVKVSFRDVAGCDEAKAELAEVVEFLKQPQRFTGLGAKIPKGVLLVGPPGTGKTLLARAVAGEAGVPFYSLSGSDFVEMFVGVGAARVRDLFLQASQNAPCIVFIDELDAIGRARGVRVGNVNDEREHTLNQLLVEMDGFEANEGVILLSATNRPDVLDAALLRPGRFDRPVVLDSPDVTARKAILEVHARGKPLAPDVDLGTIARSTPGFSGADLANAMNEAAIATARLGLREITQAVLEEAVEKVVAGPERKSRRLEPEEKRRVAYHEAGHALVATHSPACDPVHKISIVPRGRAALGYTLQLPTGDQHLLTRSALLDRMRALLGGRAAEEVVFGEVSTGAENDLEQATRLARSVVARFGMGDSERLLHCAPNELAALADLGAEGVSAARGCSEQTAAAIDEESEQLLQQLYAEARKILEQHRESLDRVATALLERETLDQEELLALGLEHSTTTTTATTTATATATGFEGRE